MAALHALDPCKATTQVAAIQITINDLHDIRPPESVIRGIALVPEPFQFFEVGLYALIIAACARVARAVNIVQRIPWDCNRNKGNFEQTYCLCAPEVNCINAILSAAGMNFAKLLW